MKKKPVEDIFLEKDRYPITINHSLKPLSEDESPFLKRKIDQARAFLDEHGLPKGFEEWKKTETSK